MVKMMKNFAGDGDKLRAPLCLRAFVAKKQPPVNAKLCGNIFFYKNNQRRVGWHFISLLKFIYYIPRLMIAACVLHLNCTVSYFTTLLNLQHMKKLLICTLIGLGTIAVNAQSVQTELYDLVKKLVTDSTGYENVGDWAVGKPKKYPVKWKADKIEMSDDTSINFFRMGTADIRLNGRSFTHAGQPVKWNVMLKGPRMGYGSFSIISSANSSMKPRYTIDSLFGKRPFTAKLLKSCDAKELAGYYYYEVKLPKKDVLYMKVSWLSLNGNTATRIDGFDNYSKYAVKLDCK